MASVLYTYADESGTDGDPEWCIIGGYMAGPRSWTQFQRRWAGTLRAYGDVPEFHAKEFFQASRRQHIPHYRGWSERKCSRFLSELLDIINSHHVVPVCCALHVPSWNELKHDDRRFLSGGVAKTSVSINWQTEEAQFSRTGWVSSGVPSRPLYGVFQRFVAECALLAREDSVVHFIFDRQNSLEPRTRETFDEQFKRGNLPQELEDRLGGISFDDSKRAEPLQAADLYAYFWNRALREALTTPLLRQTAEAVAKKKHHVSTLGKKELEGMLAHAEADVIFKARAKQANVFGQPFDLGASPTNWDALLTDWRRRRRRSR